MRFALAGLLIVCAQACGADEWVTVKGRIVWDAAKPIPKLTPLKVTKDIGVAANDKVHYDPKTNTMLNEAVLVNAKNQGIKNVFVWLAPEPTEKQLADLMVKKLKEFPSFAATDIHPDLAKLPKDVVEIDQLCCRFIPHVVAAREGQKLVIKNSDPIAHNAKYFGEKNIEPHPVMPSGPTIVTPPLLAEKAPIDISCSIHPWMKAWVRVFDHPYFAVTDADGNFEIKNAPTKGGKLRLFVWHEEYGYDGGAKGRFGKTIEVKAGTLDLKTLKFEVE